MLWSRYERSLSKARKLLEYYYNQLHKKEENIAIICIVLQLHRHLIREANSYFGWVKVKFKLLCKFIRSLLTPETDRDSTHLTIKGPNTVASIKQSKDTNLIILITNVIRIWVLIVETATVFHLNDEAVSRQRDSGAVKGAPVAFPFPVAS